MRKNNGIFEYLELQDPNEDLNKFKPFTSLTLKNRFGCKRSHSSYGQKYKVQSYLIEIESLGKSKEFIELMRFLNTSVSNQQKGTTGGIK